MLFLGASGYRNFRVGNQLIGNDIFEITPSTTNGGSTWASTPALSIEGATSRVGIGTTTYSSNATGSTVNYQLNVQGNINVNGQVYQNNLPFVTSRWTASTNDNGANIYRNSKVGVGDVASPAYQLDIAGTVNTTGVLHASGDKQWLDTYGVFKANRNTVAESVTIPTNTNCMTAGPITINNGYIITIQDGASWSIV